MNDKTNYILWLPSWYPNELQPYNGDFIQRQAFAVSAFRKIVVIHVIRDEEGKVTRSVKRTVKETEGLVEIVIYYYQRKLSLRLLEKLASYQKYKRLYKNEIIQVINDKGLPGLTHLHVALKAGIIARWISKKYGIPYILSEHWTIYLPDARPGFDSLGLLRYRVKKILKDASKVVVVSKLLGEKLKSLISITDYYVIPNVVDVRVFYPEKIERSHPAFIHISGLNYQKNPEDLLNAFKIIHDKGISFDLKIIGPDYKELRELSGRLGLQNRVLFLPEMPQEELAVHIRQSDALVLYSRYETFGCVLIEAFSCGVPVIVSDLPVFHENVVEGQNGVFARGGDPRSLAEKIEYFLGHCQLFHKSEISQMAKDKFNYDTVGRMISDLYK
jgi:glycosyltransferase involved in cell wall biosynthesis